VEGFTIIFLVVFSVFVLIYWIGRQRASDHKREIRKQIKKLGGMNIEINEGALDIQRGNFIFIVGFDDPQGNRYLTECTVTPDSSLLHWRESPAKLMAKTENDAQ
jgi:hypothetical protein